MIKIEAVLMPGKGKLILTGQLGRCYERISASCFELCTMLMQKSLALINKLFTDYDLHIHVPAGGVPKDGPSAGITMLTSILSVFTQRPINAQYA